MRREIQAGQAAVSGGWGGGRAFGCARVDSAGLGRVRLGSAASGAPPHGAVKGERGAHGGAPLPLGRLRAP